MLCGCPFPSPAPLFTPPEVPVLLHRLRQRQTPARISRLGVECASRTGRPLPLPCPISFVFCFRCTNDLSRAGQGTLQYSIFLPPLPAAATAHRPCLEGVCQLASVPCTCCLPSGPVAVLLLLLVVLWSLCDRIGLCEK